APFHFPVAVIGMGHPQPHPVKTGEGLLIFSAQVPALLAHIDMGRAVVVMIMVMPVIVTMPTAMPLWSMGMTVGMLMGQQTVFAVLLAVGQAEIAALTDPAQAQPGGVGFIEGALLLRWAAGNVVGVRVQPATLQAQGKLAGPGSYPEGTCALISHRIAAQLQVRLYAALRHIGRYTAIDQVHHTTDRTAAVHQRGRPLDHLDPFQQLHFAGNRMVGA